MDVCNRGRFRNAIASVGLAHTSIDKIGRGLFTPISNHVTGFLIKLLLIFLTYFALCKVVPRMQKNGMILTLPKSMVT